MIRTTQVLIVATTLSLGVLLSQSDAKPAQDARPSQAQGPAIGPGSPSRPHVVTGRNGHFAVAWKSTHYTGPDFTSQLLVMVGRMGPSPRVVRAVSSADRFVFDDDIALEADGGAVVTWTDTHPWGDEDPPPPGENWSMARVGPGGEVGQMAHFAGAYDLYGLLRTRSGSLAAFAGRRGRVYVSTLAPGAGEFTEPIRGPRFPRRSNLRGIEATGKASVTFLWEQSRPGRTYTGSRLVEQRVRLNGAGIGRPKPVSPWRRMGIGSYDGYSGREAFAWGDRLGAWLATGAAGRTRVVRIGSEVRFSPEVKLARAGRVFVLGQRDAPKPKAHRRGAAACAGRHARAHRSCWGSVRLDLIGAEVRGGRLVHVRRLDRGFTLQQWRLLRAPSGSVIAAVWIHGRRLLLRRLGAGFAASRTHSLRVEGDYDAAMIGQDNVAVAFAGWESREDRTGLVKVHFPRL
jgi:hypothetical protein